MSIKTYAACVLAAELFLAISASAVATSEGAEYAVGTEEISGYNASAITSYINSSTMMYDCYFSDGAAFSISCVPETDGETVYFLCIETDDPTISVDMWVNGSPIDYSLGTMITATGLYDVKITHTMSDGTPVLLEYSYNLVELGLFEDEENISDSVDVTIGRLTTEYIDGSFRYDFHDGISYVRTNILDGEITNHNVAFSISDDLYCSVMRNGEIYPLPANGILSEEGAYSMTFSSSGGAGGAEVRKLNFHICNTPVSDITVYYPPKGYNISGVKNDKGDLHGFSADSYLMEYDGEYTFSYTDGILSREVTIIRDTTSPVLYFNGTNDSSFDTAVTVTASEPCSITVSRNGLIYDNISVLGSAGFYQVTAVDTAGNETSMRIEITAASAIHPRTFAVIFGGAALTAVVFFIIMKKQRPVVR